jgi:LPXTG-site transpeptidase (sortase) family protein
MWSRVGNPWRRLVRAAIILLEVSLFAIGAILLGDTAMTAIQAAYTHRVVHAELARIAEDTSRPEIALNAPASDLAIEAPHLPAATREARTAVRLPPSVVGELTIPSLALSASALEGDTTRNLQLGVGHVSGTPLPWEPGNSAFAGHRDTFFRGLRLLRKGDPIELATPRGTFRYRVTHLLVVQPQSLWVLDRSQAALTLITCYPFTFVGAAPERFVVQADRDR